MVATGVGSLRCTTFWQPTWHIRYAYSTRGHSPQFFFWPGRQLLVVTIFQQDRLQLLDFVLGDAHADVDCPVDNSGTTALELSFVRRDVAAFWVLLSGRATPQNFVGSDGTTALHWLCDNCVTDTVST